MKIGLNSGDVVDIQTDKIIVIETSFDFTGQKKTRTIELKLRTKDQEEARLGKTR
jgi:Tfp pilus assembly protein PilP